MKELNKLLQKNQTKEGYFYTYCSTNPSSNLEISNKVNIKSPGIHSLILEELTKLDNQSLNWRLNHGLSVLLENAEKYNDFYVWKFAKPFNDFEYTHDFDDTAVAIMGIILSNPLEIVEFFKNNGKYSQDLLYPNENYKKLIKSNALWISEKESTLLTFMNREENNSIDATVNANILYTLALSNSKKSELESRLVKGLGGYINSNLFGIELDKVSKYYLYDNFFSYIVSKIQKVKGIFPNKDIDIIKEKIHSLKPKNVLDASLGILSLRNFGDYNKNLDKYLVQNENKSNKNYALFRRRRKNLYFGSPLLTYLYSSKALKK